MSLLLAGCGGGGTTTTASSTGSSSTSTGTTTTTSTGTTSASAPSGSNVTNGVVDQGPTGLTEANEAAVNILYVNVTVCAPGSTTNCQTIDHVQVDTGSQGLRLISSVLNSTLLAALQPLTVSGAAVAECTQFVDGYSWGPIVSADVHVGGSDTATTGESAPSLPVQLIGTSTYAVPTDCSDATAGATSENTVATFGANGIIGVGLFNEDCGSACATSTDYGLYFTCTSAGCNQAVVPTSEQMINPVYGLAANSSGVTDNNGVIIQLPAVSATGAATVNGYLIFGIGTESNNALSSSAAVLTTDENGYISVDFAGTTLPDSYFDSGSNALYFDDSAITTCTQAVAQGFMCPTTQQSLTATVTGQSGVSTTAEFAIGNAYDLFTNNPSFAAFSNLGGSGNFSNAGGSSSQSGSQTFAFGLPIFYGNYVYTAMEGLNAGGTDGPYFAVAAQ